MAGQLLWFSSEKGYGLIQPDAGGAPQVVTRRDLPPDLRPEVVRPPRRSRVARAARGQPFVTPGA